ncbi:MAG: sporulation protein YqfD [Clostridia bacterium]|nr:sporulation protein YqfD [Clostridia bacterium]
MRKNKGIGKNLGLYATYKVTGLNLDNLVNILKNKGIVLRDISKTDFKTLVVTVSLRDSEKFFAITRELCYNIKRIGERGKYRFALKLKRNIGMVIGAVVFAVCCIVADDFVFAIDLSGSGSVYEREVKVLLERENVKPFSRFSGLDIPALSDKILAATDDISFAECVKSGNRLKIHLVLSEKPVRSLVGEKETLISDIDGEIEYIKVYRGTALKTVGDKVKAGESLVSGYAEIKDTALKVGIIATVAVKGEFVYVYESERVGEERIAEMFATAAIGDKEIISCESVTTEIGEKYEYKVKIVYRKIFYG